MFNVGDNDYYTTDGKLRMVIDSDTEAELNAKLQNLEYFVKRECTNCIPTIKKVIFNNPATIVFWSDRTKTIVKCQEGDTYNPETGLAMAISKKALGNKGNYANEFKKWLPKEESIPAYTGYQEAVNASFMVKNKYGEKYDTRLFYAGKKHKIVCAGDCYHVKNIKQQNMLQYASLEAALADGCRPCKHCGGKKMGDPAWYTSPRTRS